MKYKNYLKETELAEENMIFDVHYTYELDGRKHKKIVGNSAANEEESKNKAIDWFKRRGEEGAKNFKIVKIERKH